MSDELRKHLEQTFVRGEISALQWVSTAKSLSTQDREHIVSRIKKLEGFLRGEVVAEYDATKPRWVPDFYEGEKKV